MFQDPNSELPGMPAMSQLGMQGNGNPRLTENSNPQKAKFITLADDTPSRNQNQIPQLISTANSAMMLTNLPESPRSSGREGQPKYYHKSPGTRKSRHDLHPKGKPGSDSIETHRQAEGSLSRIRSFLEKIVYIEDDPNRKDRLRFSEGQKLKFKQGNHILGHQRVEASALVGTKHLLSSQNTMSFSKSGRNHTREGQSHGGQRAASKVNRSRELGTGNKQDQERSNSTRQSALTERASVSVKNRTSSRSSLTNGRKSQQFLQGKGQNQPVSPISPPGRVEPRFPESRSSVQDILNKGLHDAKDSKGAQALMEKLLFCLEALQVRDGRLLVSLGTEAFKANFRKHLEILHEEKNTLILSLRRENESLKQNLTQLSTQAATKRPIQTLGSIEATAEGIAGIPSSSNDKSRSTNKDWLNESVLNLRNHPDVNSLRCKLQDLEKELVLREAGRSRDNTSSESAKSVETRQLEPHEAETGTSSRPRLSDDAIKSTILPNRVHSGPDDRSGSSGAVISTQTHAISIVKSLLEEFDSVIEALEKDIREKELQLLQLNTYQNFPDSQNALSLYGSRVSSSIRKSKFQPLKLDFSAVDQVDSMNAKEHEAGQTTSVVIPKEISSATGNRAFMLPDQRQLSASACEIPKQEDCEESRTQQKSETLASNHYKSVLPEIPETISKSGESVRFHHVSFGSMGDIKMDNSPQSRFNGNEKTPSFDVSNITTKEQGGSVPEGSGANLLIPQANYLAVSHKASSFATSASKKQNPQPPLSDQLSSARKSSASLGLPPARLAESGNIFETLHQENSSVVRAVAETMKAKEEDLKIKEQQMEQKMRQTEAFAKKAEVTINQKIQEINEAAAEVEQHEEELLMFEKGLIAREQALRKAKQEDNTKDDMIRQLSSVIQTLNQTIAELKQKLG